MIAIGMIGADSTHTEAFAKLVNLPGAPFFGRARVVKLWGENAQQAAEKAAQCQIPAVVTDPAEAIQGVDLVMVCNRFGDDHPRYARLALEAGLPTFVDKPFTNDLENTRTLVQLAAKKGAPLMSCSAVRYAAEVLALQSHVSSFGEVSCAVTSGPATGNLPDPRAAHPFFYGIHPVELLHTLLGACAEAVTTRRTARCDVGLVHYADGRQGVINLLQNAPGLYHGVVYGANGWGQADIRDFDQLYVGAMEKIIALAETGTPPYPIEWAVEVVAILTALLRSAENQGQTVRLRDL
jgi:predicted dehydrogenase